MRSVNRTVYIETSVVSYLTARPTGDLLAAAWQKATVDWWESQKPRFDLYTSDVTVGEAGRGNPQAAARRLEALGSVPILPLTEVVVELAVALLSSSAMPENAQADALHIAVSAVHGVDYLLTWNFRHLANAETRPAIRSVCAAHGCTGPEICTPRELMGGPEYV